MTYIDSVKEILKTCQVEYDLAKQAYYEKGQRLNLAHAELQRVCPHTETEIRRITEEGSYYDRTKYIKETYCTECGLFLGSTFRTGGYE